MADKKPAKNTEDGEYRGPGAPTLRVRIQNLEKQVNDLEKRYQKHDDSFKYLFSKINEIYSTSCDLHKNVGKFMEAENAIQENTIFGYNKNMLVMALALILQAGCIIVQIILGR